MSKPAATAAPSPAILTPAAITPTTNSSPLIPKYFTLSSTKPVTLVATATPKSVPSLLKPPTGPMIRTTTPQVFTATSATVKNTTSGATTKVLNLTGSGAAMVKFPMTFNMANGKSGVIPVVLSPSATGRTTAGGNVSLYKSIPTTPAILTGVGGATVVRKKPRLNETLPGGSQSSPVVFIKQEPGTSETAAAAAARRRRRTTEDGVKGLRYFATKVCDKVREKNLTTYNAVAEDLVQEYSDPHPSKSRDEVACEQKNIRRRVYDALNVLMAINVITKERKQIRWVGLPRSLNEAGIPKRENILERKRSLQQLRQRLFHSSLQLIGLKQLAQDNKERRAAKLAQDLEAIKDLPCSEEKRSEITNAALAQELDSDESQHIHMPFLFVTCGNRAEVECSVSTDAKEYDLTFSEPFKIIEDTEVLRHTALVRALDRGEYGLEEVKKGVEQLPSFMTNRFIGLLNEHQDRIKKLQENIRVQEALRVSAALEAQRQQLRNQTLQTVLNGNLPIAPAGIQIKIEEGLEPPGPMDGGMVGSSSAATFLPVVSVPNCAPIAALQSGSPVTLKPAYYIQISQPGPSAPPATPLATTTAVSPPATTVVP